MKSLARRLSLPGLLVLCSFVQRAAADPGIPITAAHANGAYQEADNEIDIRMLSRRKLKVQIDLQNNYQSPSGPSAFPFGPNFQYRTVSSSKAAPARIARRRRRGLVTGIS